VIHARVIRWLCSAKIVTDILTRDRRRRLERGDWLCFAKILRYPIAGFRRSFLRRYDLLRHSRRRWLCFAKISDRALLHQHVSSWIDHAAIHWLCFAKFTNGTPAPRKHTLLVTVEPPELRQHGHVTRMLIVSGTKTGCVLHVALGDTYPNQIKLRTRNVAGERQALATSTLTHNLPRQPLDFGAISAFAEQGTAQSATPRIA
jgi:hypothetical protein